jgi:hypothetical protein
MRRTRPESEEVAFLENGDGDSGRPDTADAHA